MKKLENHRGQEENNEIENLDAEDSNFDYGFEGICEANMVYKSIDLNDRKKSAKRNISVCSTTQRNGL